MQDDIFTAYITNLALTGGIQEKKVRACRGSDRMVEDAERQGYYYHGKNWHTTKEEAVKRAEEMRIKKIKSLRKQLEKLEKLEF